MGTFKNSMRNRARPEGSIAEAYVANGTLTFCSRYIEDVDTRFNRDAHVSSEDGYLEDDTSFLGMVSNSWEQTGSSTWKRKRWRR